MKNLLILLALICTSINASGQIEPLQIEYDSIRPLSELNTTEAGEGFPWISDDGLRIYFMKAFGSDGEIMFSERSSIDDFFSEPVALSINFEGVGSISPWVSEDELNIYFCTHENNDQQQTTLYHASRESTSEEFNEPIKVNLLGDVIGYLVGHSLSNNLDQLYVYASSYLYENAPILILDKTGDYEYTLAGEIELPSGFTGSGPGQLSSDGLRYVLGMSTEPDFNSNIYIAERESEDDEFETFYVIDNEMINNSNSSIFHPSVSRNEQFFVYTSNTSQTWAGNDIYIAYNFKPVSTTDYSIQKKNFVKVSPNPASEFINFDLENVDCFSSDIGLSIFSADGSFIENVSSLQLNPKIRLSTTNYKSGLYFYKFKCDEGNVVNGRFVINR